MPGGKDILEVTKEVFKPLEGDDYYHPNNMAANMLHGSIIFEEKLKFIND